MKNKAVDKLFANKKVGRQSFKGLKHKEDKSDLSDLEYFELLGRRVIEMDKLNKNDNIPTNYGNLDRNVCEVAKMICQAKDEGMSEHELNQYLQSCIEIEN